MIELTLRHDGANWVAHGEGLHASAATLDDLDARVRRGLVESGRLDTGDEVRVFMAFDSSTIPEWMRQYGQHYFNRIVEITA